MNPSFRGFCPLTVFVRKTISKLLMVGSLDSEVEGGGGGATCDGLASLTDGIALFKSPIML